MDQNRRFPDFHEIGIGGIVMLSPPVQASAGESTVCLAKR